jgi:sRNA-binding regulator protein Hfq
MANSRSIPQSTASHTASPDADDAEATWLHAARGKVVRVRLLEGKKLAGHLLAFDSHTLVLQGAAPVPLLVYKHSIAYLAVDEPAAES